jgi:hypothetical protein
VEVNIGIMRTFVQLGDLLLELGEIATRVSELGPERREISEQPLID